jgi:hypothetical protein
MSPRKLWPRIWRKDKNKMWIEKRWLSLENKSGCGIPSKVPLKMFKN